MASAVSLLHADDLVLLASSVHDFQLRLNQFPAESEDFGTLSSGGRGRRVLSGGGLRSCSVRCHRKRRPDRVFSLRCLGSPLKRLRRSLLQEELRVDP